MPNDDDEGMLSVWTGPIGDATEHTRQLLSERKVPPLAQIIADQKRFQAELEARRSRPNRIRSYDPASVRMTVGGVEITGTLAGSFLQPRDPPRAAQQTTAYRSGRVTFTLVRSSPSIGKFNDLFGVARYRRRQIRAAARARKLRRGWA